MVFLDIFSTKHGIAKLLNISPETVRKWEHGDRHPTGASLKLLNLVSAHGLQALY